MGEKGKPLSDKEPAGWSPQSFRLEKNAVIKLGRVRLRVRDIDYPEVQGKKNKAEDSTPTAVKDLIESPDKGVINQDSPSKIDEDARKTADPKSLAGVLKGIKNKEVGQNSKTFATDESEFNCKMCWGTQKEDIENGVTEDDNPFITPCKCAGSMAYVHLKCLRDWMNQKRTYKTHKKQVIIKFKRLECEVCKVNYPFKLAKDNKIIDIVDFDVPKSNFIVLESL